MGGRGGDMYNMGGVRECSSAIPKDTCLAISIRRFKERDVTADRVVRFEGDDSVNEVMSTILASLFGDVPCSSISTLPPFTSSMRIHFSLSVSPQHHPFHPTMCLSLHLLQKGLGEVSGGAKYGGPTSLFHILDRDLPLVYEFSRL